MTWIISQIISRLWIFMSIFMFFPVNLYVTSGFANVWFFTSACNFVNHAWWMWVFTIELKQLLHLFLWPTVCVCRISHQWNCQMSLLIKLSGWSSFWNLGLIVISFMWLLAIRAALFRSVVIAFLLYLYSTSIELPKSNKLVICDRYETL